MTPMLARVPATGQATFAPDVVDVPVPDFWGGYRVRGDEVVEHLAERRAGGLDRPRPADVGAQGGRNPDARHACARGPAQNST